MKDFEYTDHAGDTVHAVGLSSTAGCNCGPGTVRIDAHLVHLPIPQQRALAQWLIDHLAEVRPGEDVSLVLPYPQVTLEERPERPSGYLLTLSVEGAELSVSDGVSLPSMEMQMLIDAAGRAMERFRLDLDTPTPQAAADLDEFLGRLAEALHIDPSAADDGFDADELIADVEQLYANNAHHADGYVRKSEMLDARHREMARALGAGANATFEQLIGIAKRAVAQPGLKQLRALMPPQVVSGQDGSAITYFTDLAAQWKRIRDALHAAGRPVPPGDTATTIENVLADKVAAASTARDRRLARADLLEDALLKAREDIARESYSGADEAIVQAIDAALSGSQALESRPTREEFADRARGYENALLEVRAGLVNIAQPGSVLLARDLMDIKLKIDKALSAPRG
jgi:hypothetical protein